MQIVIDIPRELYEQLMESNADDFDGFIEGELVGFIQNGTPLPKGHGRLIDADNITSISLEDSVSYLIWEKGSEIDCKIDAPTIIGADKESDNEVSN